MNDIKNLKRMSQVGVRQSTPTPEMPTADSGKAFDILQEARTCWLAMDKFRRDRERNKRYTYGDQWDDVICVDGKRMTEAQYIASQGNIPLKNNLIRRMVRSVLGVYASQQSEPVCVARDRDEQKAGETMSTVLQCNMQLNRMKELNSRSMEEFLISGFVVHRHSFGWRNDKLDCWTDYVQPNNFFIDTNTRDFRGWDCNLVGEIHDVDFKTMLNEFADTPEDSRRLTEIYAMSRNRNALGVTWSDFGYGNAMDYDFLVPRDPGVCRIIEVWRKECKPRYRCHDYNTGELYKIDEGDYADIAAENSQRMQLAAQYGIPMDEVPLIQTEWFIDNVWCYYYISPFGDILRQGETPYAHKSHPYVFKAYPFIDGEIHSFVSDVIDQQRYTNRLITMYDWIMRTSAKGVLLFPEECLPKGMTIEDVADEWARYDGVIMIKQPKTGTALPQQIHANATPIGISELLNLQLKFFEDITGVHGALQGKQSTSATSGVMYNMQTQNATMSLLDLLEAYSSFVIDGAYKVVKNIQQYYDDIRVFNIAGKSASRIVYDPKHLGDIDFDLSITESTSTPAYRQMANEMIMQLYQSGAISVEQMLEHGNFPFADELLQSIKTQKEQMQTQGGAPEGISPQLMAQARQGADMDAVSRAQKALQGG